jgi:lysophospholipid acyltransferase (LPLAT)-like uncharacterized protein
MDSGGGVRERARSTSRGCREALELAVIPPLGRAALHLLGCTVRTTEVNAGPWGPKAPRRENAIYAFWHSSLLMASFFYRHRGIVGLISLSRDGEILARVLEPLGYVLVRGSTSRGRLQALRGLVRRLAEGRDVALAPDGPRGPREIVQPGIIELARLTGKRIVPFVFDCSHKKRLRSWDRLIVPMPFSKGVVAFEEPVGVGRGAGREEMEAQRSLLEERLHAAGRRAAEWLAGTGCPGIP